MAVHLAEISAVRSDTNITGSAAPGRESRNAAPQERRDPQQYQPPTNPGGGFANGRAAIE
jgi:hypothetical protein